MEYDQLHVPDMAKKGELPSSLASSVAALAASAAREKPKVKATPRRGSRKPDADQENALVRKSGKVASGSGASAAQDGAERPQAIAADQTRVLVSGLPADVQAEDLENAFRFRLRDDGPQKAASLSAALLCVCLASCR